MAFLKFKSAVDQDSAGPLVRRMLTEQALVQWKSYAFAFTLMAIAAGATSLCAYLVGTVINAAYVDKNLPGIVWFAMFTAVLFLIKSIATYGQSVLLSRIGNRIVAINQRRMFDALIRQNI